MRRTILVVTLAAALAVLASPSAQANYGEGSSSGGSNIRVNTRLTDMVVRDLRHDFGECLQLFPAYRYDCYRISYRSAAVQLKGSIDYQPAYEALRLVEQRISTLVKANTDPSQKKLRKGLQRFTPVTEAALPAMKQETIRAMEEAQTLLLRSPAPHQKPHFQKIAAVIDSNKVLLRSALLKLQDRAIRLAGWLVNRAGG